MIDFDPSSAIDEELGSQDVTSLFKTTSYDVVEEFFLDSIGLPPGRSRISLPARNLVKTLRLP